MPIEIQQVVVEPMPMTTEVRREVTSPPAERRGDPDLDQALSRWHQAAALRRDRLRAD